jgi:uncharacterized protein
MNALDSRLLDILVCPICKGPLKHERPSTAPDHPPAAAQPSDLQGELLCNADKLAFPIRDGIARMLVDEARSLT